MYRLIGKDGSVYESETKGQLGGHRRLKIYGRLDCPSALRHIAAGEYTPYRVFFPDEETALAAGYRPCAVCMKEHYRLWKEGRLLSHALDAFPVLDGAALCGVKLASGETRLLDMAKLRDTPIPARLQKGLEDCQLKIDGDNCVILLAAEKYQWAFTIVWDYVRDKIVHLSDTPFAVDAAVWEDRLVVLYLVQYWGHPADLWFSAAPLEKVDAGFSPERQPLALDLDKSVTAPDSCQVSVRNGEVYFRAGTREIRLSKR